MRVLPLPVAISTSSLRRPSSISPAQDVDAVPLVGTASHAGVDGHLGRRDPERAGGEAPLQLVPAEDRRHRTEVGVAVEVAEADLLTVGEEHERHLEGGGVGERLWLGLAQRPARALGLDNR